MVRSDVEQYRHVGVEAVGEIDLVALQFQHIDATCGQWVLRQYGQADIPAHPRRDVCIAHNMMDARRRRRLAIRAGDGDDPMLGQAWAGEREKFDVADDGNTRLPRLIGYGMTIERHAGGNDHAVKTGKINSERISDFRHAHHSLSCIFPVVPGDNMGSAVHQRLDRGHAGAGQAKNGIFLSCKVGTDARSEEHTSELQSLLRISYAVFCLKKNIPTHRTQWSLPYTCHLSMYTIINTALN